MRLLGLLWCSELFGRLIAAAVLVIAKELNLPAVLHLFITVLLLVLQVHDLLLRTLLEAALVIIIGSGSVRMRYVV